MRAWFDRALEIDPNDADALAGEAYTYCSNMTLDGQIPRPITTRKYSARPTEPSRSLATTLNLFAKSSYLGISHRANEALASLMPVSPLIQIPPPLRDTRQRRNCTCGRFEQARPMWNKQCG